MTEERAKKIAKGVIIVGWLTGTMPVISLALDARSILKKDKQSNDLDELENVIECKAWREI